MNACEHINGLRVALEMGEWKAAYQIGTRALKSSPCDPLVWWHVGKSLLKYRESYWPSHIG